MSARVKDIALIASLGLLGFLQGCGDQPCAPRDRADVRCAPAPPYWPRIAPHWSERDIRIGMLPAPPPPPPPERPLWPRPSPPIRAQGAGGSASLVFSNPDLASLPAGAEYSRNDQALSPRPDQPLLASTEWPERERASLAYPRYVYLSNQPNQLLFFENESKYRGYAGYGGYLSIPAAPTQGVWGFWR